MQKLIVDEAKIKKAILSGIPITVSTSTMPREVEIYIEEVITFFLKYAGKENLKDYIVYSILELAANAKKANTKRVYFIERGLDISNEYDYSLGMEQFRENALANNSHFLKLQEEKGLYISLTLQMRENIIQIEIRNNAAVTNAELTRIHDRLARSRQYQNLDEVFSQILDDSEGAGLGLIILVLMLKKIGLNEDCFDIRNNEKETIARIQIPMDQVDVENVRGLSQAIVDNIDSLPQFPENILEIQRLLNDPDADMGIIARQMSMDPALIADLFRIVNSAQYMLAKRIDNITEAVNLVGIRGIKNLLYSYGTRLILGADSTDKKELWEHSYKTAFYAYNLIKQDKRNRGFLDDVYASGILHDIGKIIFSNVYPDMLNKIRDFCAERNIPKSTFEYLSAGMNHAEIGALVAEKWNFPEKLVASIRYHHNPSAAPGDCRTLVESVYLADMFCEYEKGNVSFEQFETDPLKNFGISAKPQMDDIIKQFAAGLKKANEN
ncbi:MAG: HDOD domain-containing protein [Treponema sp.]|jgi:putative nucleotidyltransferase with HDIG domain|nr:HDOD domain-containing protein [Treponema sp.]